ncbi:MAG: hypothetical protein WB699_16730 [Bacteroidota bacterium]
MKQTGISLGKIIRSFKAHSTRMIRKEGLPCFAWESLYHDRIIRNSRELFFISRYIRLNPLLDSLRSATSNFPNVSSESLRNLLKDKYSLGTTDVSYLMSQWIRRSPGKPPNQAP